MFKIADGRDNFYQWDLDRKIIIEDSSINEVHFCNKTDNCSLVCEVYEENGIRLVNVPNILLQTDWDIRVYGYCNGSYTKHSARFKVASRSKPADYVYTETDLLTVEEFVIKALEEAKLSGDFKGDKGDKGDSGAIEFVVVTELPTTDIKNAIYLVPSEDTQEQNIYKEYVYIDGVWECIGSTGVEVNLDEYMKEPTQSNKFDGVLVRRSGSNENMWATVDAGNGLALLDSGMLVLSEASKAQVANRTSGKPICANLLDYAVKEALTTNKETLTDDEKAAAQNWLGLGGIEAALDAIIAIQESLIGGENV